MSVTRLSTKSTWNSKLDIASGWSSQDHDSVATVSLADLVYRFNCPGTLSVPRLQLVPNSSEMEAILAFLSFTLPASILDESSCANPDSVDQSASPRSSPLWP
ncbi:uncharacterized protein ARMOST_19845 [Armillaria ostoyae]|uniref:Uncharacterized protein n=1 Tax=Armillaria ostoyae TaxID=47428 RepID=A0A284S5N7_ARMOS|nr:uncharacterized protein ARMOST_19845 [Armillaria ostoyae]